MANKKKSNFGGKLLLFLLELVLAVAILFFVAKMLPKDLTLTSIGSGISESLLITTPAPEVTDEPTAAPTPVALVTPEITEEPEEEPEVGLATEVPTESGIEETDETEADASESTDGMIESETGADAEAADDQTDSGETTGDEQAEPAITEAPAVTPEPELVSTARTSSITITAAGDCTLGGDETNGGLARFEKVFDTHGEEYFFENVRHIFEQDDITIVNLEGTFTGESSRKDTQFAFKGDPRFAKILTAGSVEVVSIDNNHTQDYYSQGLADTKKTLDYVGVGYAGLGEKHIMTVEGMTVGFLSYRVWTVDVGTMTSEIQALKQECDLVVVSMHWGEEKVGKANKTQIKLGHAAVDAGADLVLGHHPHVVGSIEVYNGKYIVYSLGNFCFGGNSNPADKDTFIFQQTFNFTEGELTGTEIEIIPCSISSVSDTNDYKPTPLAYEEGGLDVMKKIIKHSQQFESVPDWKTILTEMEAEAGIAAEETAEETAEG